MAMFSAHNSYSRPNPLYFAPLLLLLWKTHKKRGYTEWLGLLLINASKKKKPNNFCCGKLAYRRAELFCSITKK